MQLEIMSPQGEGFAKEIEWNNEELKAEIAAKMQDYKGLVFTEETIKEAKKDRATLNKLKYTFEEERKRIKKLYLDPYNKFEAQVKELISLIDEPIGLIDAQIKEVEENKKLQKRKDIEELFASIGFQNFVKIEMIWDAKWLNVTVPMSKIEEQMKSTMYQIGEEVATINQLPEFSFEAMDTYKRTLNLSAAIQEGRRLSEIQRRKAAAEEEQRRKQEEESRRKAEEILETVEELEKKETDEKASCDHNGQQTSEKIMIDFRVNATREQLAALKNFLQENQIEYGPVPKKGE